ncbi:MAG: DNA-processing protein DprA [Gammaproteobacteria bacterium]
MRTPGVGCRTFLKILESFTPEQVFRQPLGNLAPLELSAKSLEYLKNPDWARIERDLAWLQQSGNAILTLNDPAYPALLKQIADPPPLLFVRGNLELLSAPQIAIVGSRNPSHLGRETAEAFAYDLASQGYTVTSGLALGIDAAGHSGALKATGRTIAVAGTGPDRIYPACHKDLAIQIIAQGTIVSEFPPETQALANHFPRRNRIISGLSLGLLVVEAAQQSGSLITARLALEQNREVFAIPGSIHDPLARGCNALIREGAKLVENTQDILEELHQYNQYVNKENPHQCESVLDLEQQKLLNLIPYSPTSVDTLVKQSGLSVEIISSMLLILELHGHIVTAAGGGYIRNK